MDRRGPEVGVDEDGLEAEVGERLGGVHRDEGLAGPGLHAGDGDPEPLGGLLVDDQVGAQLAERVEEVGPGARARDASEDRDAPLGEEAGHVPFAREPVTQGGEPHDQLGVDDEGQHEGQGRVPGRLRADRLGPCEGLAEHLEFVLVLGLEVGPLLEQGGQDLALDRLLRALGGVDDLLLPLDLTVDDLEVVVERGAPGRLPPCRRARDPLPRSSRWPASWNRPWR